MKDNINGTRQEEITVEEYLEQKGLTHAVDIFLVNQNMHDTYHEIFSGACLAKGEEFKALPETIQKYAKKMLECFEKTVSSTVPSAASRAPSARPCVLTNRSSATSAAS